MAEKNESNAFFWGFVFGAAAGAVLTLLKTPRSGKETIGEIRSRGMQMRTRGVDYAEHASSRMSDYAQSAQGQASDLAKQAGDQAQNAGEVAATKIEEAVDSAKE